MPTTYRKRAKAPAKRVKPRTNYRRSMTRGSRASTTTHAFIRKQGLNTIAGAAGYAPFQSYTQIRFANVINSSEFSALYDQYVIDKVKVQFWLKVDPGAQTATMAIAPKLYWYRDLDDQSLASQNDMRERSNSKIAVLRTDRPVTIWVKPNVLNLVYRGVATSSYVPKFSQWLDMSATDVDHYGIKYNIDDLTTTAYKVDVETTYYFRCKNTR